MPGFRFHHRLHVRFRDCDMFGHVNNAVYFTYMEEARWAYWREITGDMAQDRLPGLILARAECDFIRPLRSGERVDVGVAVTRIGRSSVSFDCEVLDEQGAAVAKGKSVMVSYDYAASRPAPIPDVCRVKIEEYEGRSLSRAERS